MLDITSDNLKEKARLKLWEAFDDVWAAKEGDILFKLTNDLGREGWKIEKILVSRGK